MKVKLTERFIEPLREELKETLCVDDTPFTEYLLQSLQAGRRDGGVREVELSPSQVDKILEIIDMWYDDLEEGLIKGKGWTRMLGHAKQVLEGA